MKKTFDEKGWIIFNQPPQSPITNVHDACIFPMMSKKVSREQATTFGSRLLKGEQLHQTVMKVWNDTTNRQALGRAFAGHHQIVETIRQYKGDNKFLTEKGGLSFGVRRTYICNEEGTGVIPVTIAPQNELETRAGQLLNQQRINGLKYSPPKATDLTKAVLSQEMKDMLLELMDPNLMTDDLHEVWYQLSDTSENRPVSGNQQNHIHDYFFRPPKSKNGVFCPLEGTLPSRGQCNNGPHNKNCRSAGQHHFTISKHIE